MATTISADDPATTLADVLARVSRGEEITLTERGNPVARVLPVATSEGSQRKSLRGSWKGKAWIADDFTAPLPEEELREWEK